ncbi:MAG: UDP-N-acetylmuramoyl-L-alanine--D-glutamate ligase [Clostridia bacterium]|nr:UDP-N-acetylmuramoyl-L-alanine--D-glutamate ligase [Clostridia bacterium]
MKNIDSIEELRGTRCDVLGIGISNLPLIEILLGAGASVTARDKKSREALGDNAFRLEEKGVRLILGENYLDGIDADVIFRSPGIRPDLPQITSAVRKGAVLLSEMELFFKLTKSNIIAVTGSDGKTTTTTLTHLFLSKQLERHGGARAYVGGNIGAPLLPKYEEMTERDYAVLELSSFQLMTMGKAPSRAAITNVTPNHLNWHADMDEYIRAKRNVFGEETLLVLNAENDITRDIANERGRDMILFSSKKASFDEIVSSAMKNVSAVFLRNGKLVYSDGSTEDIILDASEIKLAGIHNVENYMTAIALTWGLVDKDIYAEVASSFGGVEHRLEFVREYMGVKYYNSSIDSSPTRTSAALSAIKTPKIVICGGYDKNIPFEPLADALCENAKCAVLTGAAAMKIKNALLSCPKYSPEKLKIVEEDEFDDAVLTARDCAESGDTVLLSPACASFDRFSNFEERGNHFKKLVLSFGENKN